MEYKYGVGISDISDPILRENIKKIEDEKTKLENQKDEMNKKTHDLIRERLGESYEILESCIIKKTRAISSYEFYNNPKRIGTMLSACILENNLRIIQE